jgi:hypothetical protein
MISRNWVDLLLFLLLLGGLIVRIERVDTAGERT